MGTCSRQSWHVGWPIALILGLLASPAIGQITYGTPTPLPGASDPTYDESQPSWSLDGQWIVYSSNKYGNFDIFKIPASGGVPTRLTSDPQHEWYPHFSPDGTKIFYSKVVGANLSNIWVMNSDGTNPQQLTSGYCDYDPVPSPDGSKVLFWSNRAPGDNNHAGSFTMNPDGTGITFLVYGSNGRWSKDGSKLAFMNPYQLGVWVSNADGSGAHACSPRINSSTDGGGGLDWSPAACNQLAYTCAPSAWPQCNQYGLSVIDASSCSGPTQVVPMNSGVHYISWSPDASRIAYMGGCGTNQDILLLPVNGCGGVPNSQPFCENFDDGTWTSRWATWYGVQTLVSSPTHSGSGALRLYGTTYGQCGSSIYRRGFLAGFGDYSAWVRHENPLAEPRLYVMVDPGNTSTDPVYRQSYMAAFSGSNATSGLVGICVYRVEPNNTGVLLASKSSAFPMNEWARVYIRVQPGGKIVAGYEWSGGSDEMQCLDNNPSPIAREGLFLLYTCADGITPSNVYDDACYTPLAPTNSNPFCDNFDDGGGWQSRWVSTQGGHTLVNTPVHSGTGSIRTDGVIANPPHSMLKRANFAAAVGEYSAWFYQTNTWGGAIYTQVDPSGNPATGAPHSYRMGFNASDGAGGGVIDLTKIDAAGIQSLMFSIPSPHYVKNQWVRPFFRNEGQGRLYVGYESNGVRYEYPVIDPVPLLDAGECYLLSNGTNYYDDVCYDPNPNAGIPTPNHDNPGFAGSRCFNGQDAYVTVPANSTLNPSSALTIEAWINLKDLPSADINEYAIVSKWSGSGYLFGVAGGTFAGKLLINLNLGDPHGSLYSTTALVPGQWYHVAATYDGSTMSLFINGMLDSWASLTGLIANSGTPLAIGKNTHNDINSGVKPYFFNGQIDEVRISNKARSLKEFALAAPAVNDANTIALWHMDDAGSTVADASTNGNNGTAMGSGCGHPATGPRLVITSLRAYNEFDPQKPPTAAYPAVLEFTLTNAGDERWIPSLPKATIFTSDECGSGNFNTFMCDYFGSQMLDGFLHKTVPIEYPCGPGPIDFPAVSLDPGASATFKNFVRFYNPDLDEKLTVLINDAAGPLYRQSGTPVPSIESTVPFWVERNSGIGFNCAATVAAVISGAFIIEGVGLGAALIGTAGTSAQFTALALSLGTPLIGGFSLLNDYKNTQLGMQQIADGNSQGATHTVISSGLDVVKFLTTEAPIIVNAGLATAGQTVGAIIGLGKGLFNELVHNGCLEWAIEIKRSIGKFLDDWILKNAWKLFSQFKLPPIIIRLGCPIALTIHSSDGTSNHADVSGQTQSAIPGSEMVNTDSTIVGFLPQSSTYDLQIVGLASGSCDLAIGIPVNDSAVLVSYFDSVPVMPGSIVSVNQLGRGDHQLVANLDIDGDGTVDRALVPSRTSDSGELHVLVSSGGQLSNFGIAVDVYNALDSLVAELMTDENGRCETPKLMAGEYHVSIMTPLGFSADSSSKSVVVVRDSSQVNFTITQAALTRNPKGLGYWKHQFRSAIEGKGKPQENIGSLSNYLGTIGAHFNDNRLNAIDIFTVTQPAAQKDSLKAMANLLGDGRCGDHDSHDDGEHREHTRDAKRQLAALLLNVASGKLSQFAWISRDSMTASQAITYCNWLITSDAVCTERDDDHDLGKATEANRKTCLELAAEIAERINDGRTIGAGIIPKSVENIAYRNGTDESPLPTDFHLAQNYPNPFNPSTTISFSLPTVADYTLTIYNVAGQTVKEFNGHSEAGDLIVSWDASGMASGVYLYRLTAGSFTDTKKMLLLK